MPETTYPLKVLVCDKCWLVQTEDYASAEDLFSASYAYFSSTSISWLEHAKRYVEGITSTLGLDKKSFVVELASNDGYLLKNFVAAGIPCLGIEPTADTADAAEKLGVPVLRKFFGEAAAMALLQSDRPADLIIGNNVYAHVPDINDFTRGMKHLLKEGGAITLEFPHLLNLVRGKQFDTVYHEHYSYLSLFTVERIFASHGLRIFRVDRLATHGGSLRVYGCHADDVRQTDASIPEVLHEEGDAGLRTLEVYKNFQADVNTIKNTLLTFLLQAAREGKRVAAYGAAAKGNTLLNYAGVRPDLLPVVYDAAASKQGKFLPGSHIPVLAPKMLAENPPDYLLILPWNIAEEIKGLGLAGPNTRYVTAVPELVIE